MCAVLGSYISVWLHLLRLWLALLFGMLVIPIFFSTHRTKPSQQQSIKHALTACPQIRQPGLIRVACSLIHYYIGQELSQRSIVVFVTRALLVIRIYI